jgi:hypothetical protein
MELIIIFEAEQFSPHKTLTLVYGHRGKKHVAISKT